MNSRYLEVGADAEYWCNTANSEFIGRTEIQNYGILSPTHLNVLTSGGESASDQRLSGLASGRKLAHAVQQGHGMPARR